MKPSLLRTPITKGQVTGFTVAAILGLSVATVAAPDDVALNSFSSGQTISSSDVNDNFAELARRIAAQEVVDANLDERTVALEQGGSELLALQPALIPAQTIALDGTDKPIGNVLVVLDRPAYVVATGQLSFTRKGSGSAVTVSMAISGSGTAPASTFRIPAEVGTAHLGDGFLRTSMVQLGHQPSGEPLPAGSYQLTFSVSGGQDGSEIDRDRQQGLHGLVIQAFSPRG